MLLTAFTFTVLNVIGPLASGTLLSTGAGAPGLGRSLYTPTCCYACLNSLWSLALPCWEPIPSPSFFEEAAPCHASDPSYLESLAWCMTQRCPSEGVGEVEVNKCWQKIAGDGLKVDPIQEYLKTQPNQTLEVGAPFLAGPSLVDDVTYGMSRDTLLTQAYGEKYHQVYSLAIVGGSVGFALLVAAKLGVDRVLLRIVHRPLHIPPVISKYLLIPALIGKRHLRILPFNLGYVPDRATCLMIALFVGLNVAFDFFGFPSFENNTWYASSGILYEASLANRLGITSIANLALAIMLSGRSSILMYLTGCSRSTILAYHRWAGRVAVAKGIAHSAIYLSATDKYLTGITTAAGALHYLGANSAYWELGITALSVFAAILLFSFAPFRVPWYELFLLSHVALALAALVTLWYHLVLRFHYQYGYEIWLYVAFAFWGFDRIVRAGYIVFLNRGLVTGRKPPAKIELLPNSDFVRVTVYPSAPWVLQPGQYCFVYFPTLTWFWESHPFSVASWTPGTQPGEKVNPATRSMTNSASDVESDTPPITMEKSVDLRSKHASISFIIRPADGITKRLRSRLSEGKPEITLPVLIEGPYGSPSSMVFASETILAFAGGVGITGILGHLHNYITVLSTPNTRPTLQFATRRFVLYWLVRSRKEVDAIMPLLPDPGMMGDLGIELHVSRSDEPADRLEFGAEIGREREIMGSNTTLSVLTCAPAGMSDEIRYQVAEAIGMQGARIAFHEEAFAW